MPTFISFTLGLSLALFSTQLIAQDTSHSGHASPYAGFETRAIKSLSQDDIEELRRGGGWGLALAGELNGAPGPAHLLELKDEIGLSPEQVAAIQDIFTEMQAEAIAAGKKFIVAEKALDAAFIAGNLTNSGLRILIDDAQAARSHLRFVHLSRHLSTPPLLSQNQIERYKTLRGYGNDPCAQAPQGHDAEMWRKHNGCG